MTPSHTRHPRAAHRFAHATVIACALLASLSCGDDASGPNNTGSLRVLFLGNSLTYTNDLPSVVAALAAASGESIVVDDVTSGGASLEDLWNGPSARSRVINGNFDVVVMQQGPSSLPESRVYLREWTAEWNALIRAHGGRPALYAVWPEQARAHVFADVSESYRLAAQDVGGLFLPAGDTWLETWAAMPDAPLYGEDNFHPSPAGTYAAAVVIVAVLTNRSATSLSTSLDLPGITSNVLSDELAAQIRLAASTVIAREGQQLATGSRAAAAR